MACSPFSKTENAKIALAWKILNAQSSSLTPSNLDASTCSSGPVSEVMSDLSPPRSQTQTVQSSDSELDTISPKRGSKSDLKGKGKLIAKQSKSGDDDEEASSFKSSLPQSENIGSEEFKSQDGVLNLSLEDEFYIVPVGLDSLFTVDVRRLKLYPAFWHGPQLDVYRGQWFYPSTNKHKFYPCEPELAEALEAAYDQIRPWDLSYEDELRSALKIGTEAEDKLKVHLKKFDHDVIFQTASQGRLYSTAVSSRISKTILTNFFTSISKKTAGYSGGTVVVRGWDQAQIWSGVASEDDQIPMEVDQNGASFGNENQAFNEASGFNTTADMLQEEDLENPHAKVSELVLVIHGIGQKLAQSYDSFDFVHACNQLRVECHKASIDPKMGHFLQNRRVQFIPIRWRHSLNFEMEGFDEQGEAQDVNDEKADNNAFTMKDIQIPDSIPFVREIVTGLVLDVPLYMSPKQHKRMIAAVMEQANKVYQLFCRRNPYYTGRKVSILAHSLGAALTVDILSRQPSPWTSDVEANKIMGDTQGYLSSLHHFCFDTSKVFLVGSPVAFFFHLHRAQLIAREGLSQSSTLDLKNSPDWRKLNRVATDEVGRYGCLAAETIYNIYISTDPVAYCMNACVDSQHSKQIKPIDAHSFTKKVLETMRRKHPVSSSGESTLRRNPSLASFSSLVVNSWMSYSKKVERDLDQINHRTAESLSKPGPKSLNTDPSRSMSMGINWPSTIKKRAWMETSNDNGREEPFKKNKKEDLIGRSRFVALNPSGSIDFVIPSLGLNQYVDMVTAHAAYWTDIRFARLILIGLFAGNEVLNEVGDSELESNLL